MLIRLDFFGLVCHGVRSSVRRSMAVITPYQPPKYAGTLIWHFVHCLVFKFPHDASSRGEVNESKKQEAPCLLHGSCLFHASSALHRWMQCLTCLKRGEDQAGRRGGKRLPVLSLGQFGKLSGGVNLEVVAALVDLTVGAITN